MSRKSKKQKRRSQGPAGMMAPKIRVNAAIGDTDLQAAARFIKPAILYADRVTVYSPAATILETAKFVSSVASPHDRLSSMMQAIERNPRLRQQLEVDTDTLQALKRLVTLRNTPGWRALQLGVNSKEVAELGRLIDGLTVTTGSLDEVLDYTATRFQAKDFVVAINAGAVEVKRLELLSDRDSFPETEAAVEASSGSSDVDAYLRGFLGHLRKVVTDNKGFPLLDAKSTSLVRQGETDGTVVPKPRTMLHGSEVGIASTSMGYLPSFPDLPMDEVIDLRGVLHGPLYRFRVEMANLARQLDTRPIDDEFEDEATALWRLKIEPSLRELRETMSDNGLLKTAASVMADDYKALLAEAGGVLHLGQANTWDIVGTAAATLAVPVGHTIVRSVRQNASNRRTARRHSLFFLHRLDAESRRRSR